MGSQHQALLQHLARNTRWQRAHVVHLISVCDPEPDETVLNTISQFKEAPTALIKNDSLKLVLLVMVTGGHVTNASVGLFCSLLFQSEVY